MTQVFAFYPATLNFNTDCAKRGLGCLKPSVLTTLRHKVSFFVACKTPHCLRWDKNSRIVKDYTRLLLHCISWYREPCGFVCVGCWWGHMALPDGSTGDQCWAGWDVLLMPQVQRCMTSFIFFLSPSPPWNPENVSLYVAGMNSWSKLRLHDSPGYYWLALMRENAE